MGPQYGQLIEPPPVPFAFGAPGWYVLAFLLLLVLGALIWLTFRLYKRNGYRRRALKEITELQRQYPGQGPEQLYKTNMLLKRIAMSVYQRSETAGARNTDWIDFLNQTMRKELFTTADTTLLESLYTGKTPAAASTPLNSFIAKAISWIRQHKHGSRQQHKIAAPQTHT